MEGAQSALWYVRECKESDDESRGQQRKTKLKKVGTALRQKQITEAGEQNMSQESE